jgi:hypothetical protein
VLVDVEEEERRPEREEREARREMRPPPSTPRGARTRVGDHRVVDGRRRASDATIRERAEEGSRVRRRDAGTEALARPEHERDPGRGQRDPPRRDAREGGERHVDADAGALDRDVAVTERHARGHAARDHAGCEGGHHEEQDERADHLDRRDGDPRMEDPEQHDDEARAARGESRRPDEAPEP